MAIQFTKEFRSIYKSGENPPVVVITPETIAESKNLDPEKQPIPSKRSSLSLNLQFSSSDPLEKKFNLRDFLNTERACSDRPEGSKRLREKIEEKPASFIVVVPLSLIIDRIGILVISYKRWEEKVRDSLVSKVLKSDFSKGSTQLIIEKMYDGLLGYSSILERITKAKNLLEGVSEHNFLKKFSKKSNPARFWKSYDELNKRSPTKCEVLYQIIGKEQALKIIKESSVKAKFQSQLETICSVEKDRSNLSSSLFTFHKGFDYHNLKIVPIPIFLLEWQDFDESFRSYYSDGPFSCDTIRINGEDLVIPNYEKMEIDEEKRGFFFQKWLISNIQEKLGIQSSLTVKDQLKVFMGDDKADFKFDVKKLRKLISKIFSDEFGSNIEKEEVLFKLIHCLKKLEKEKDGKDFAEQMLPFSEFISKYLIHQKNFQDCDWNQVSYSLFKLYRRFYHLHEKQSAIPSLSLLKGLCYASYSSGEMFMRTTLCPNLFQNDSLPYHLLLNHDEITKYSIISYGGSFDVTHIKSFEILAMDKVKKARIQLDWIVSGRLNSREYSSALQIPKFDFCSDCSFEERRLILDLFNLNCENCPWGHFLKKMVMRDQFPFPV